KTTRGKTDERMEHALIVLRFENGVIAHVEGSWTNYPGQFYTSLEISGTKGMITFDSRKTAPIFYAKAVQDEKQVNVTLPESPSEVSQYELELADMISAIQEDRDPKVTLAEALATTRVAPAALKWAEAGSMVNL